MRSWFLALVAFAGAVSSSHFAQAAFISGLYSTGVNNSGIVLAPNTVDVHYQIITAPTGVTVPSNPLAITSNGNNTFPIGPWIGDNSTSRWLVPNNGNRGNDPPSNATSLADITYVWETKFNVAGLASNESLTLVGDVAADNWVYAVKLNGSVVQSWTPPVNPLTNPSGSGSQDYAAFKNFTINSSLFINGINSLQFVTYNYPQSSGNPTGLRVEFASDLRGPAVPAPAAMVLFALGLPMVGLLPRRKVS